MPPRRLGADLGEWHRADFVQGDRLRLAVHSALSQVGYEPWHDNRGTV